MPTPDPQELEAFMAAIREQESGGEPEPYAAFGRPTGDSRGVARGAYQIMSGYWDAWAQQAGRSGANWRVPENQDAVARYKFQQYYDQYDGDWQLVAIAWFGGPGRANEAQRRGLNSVGGLKDGLGKSIAGYASDVMEKFQKHGGGRRQNFTGGSEGGANTAPGRITTGGSEGGADTAPTRAEAAAMRGQTLAMNQNNAPADPSVTFGDIQAQARQQEEEVVPDRSVGRRLAQASFEQVSQYMQQNAGNPDAYARMQRALSGFFGAERAAPGAEATETEDDPRTAAPRPPDQTRFL